MSVHRSVLFSPALVLAALVFLLIACGGPQTPPAAEGPELPITYPDSFRGEQVDRYHGVDVADPYRWLEDLEGEKTAIWVGSQNAVAEPFLGALPRRDAIKERLTELWNYERFSPPIREGSRYFYLRNDGLQDQDVLYVTDSLQGDARVLIDPNVFSEDRTASLSQFEVSPDARLIAYSISEGGSD
ncbi:MAG TPA: S9 family peptidase, partial [Candidatus Polarisedimenticolia bacterium]|nr:S9 family peptidase [Candidatus Polarisedimenticolia bacterium]